MSEQDKDVIDILAGLITRAVQKEATPEEVVALPGVVDAYTRLFRARRMQQMAEKSNPLNTINITATKAEQTELADWLEDELAKRQKSRLSSLQT